MMLAQPILTSPTARLLAWYDVHKRVLPWRALSGDMPDPYHVWLSEIMLQQTTVASVIPYFITFLQLFPTLKALADAPTEQVMRAWAGLGYYSRARNLHHCAQELIRDYQGQFPKSAQELRALSGIGDYTSAAIAAIAFGEPIVAVDGNVERVISRFYALSTPLPAGKAMVRQKAQALMPTPDQNKASLCGDMVQALMELGATICTPKNPACDVCPWHIDCMAYALQTPTAYPLKKPKKPAQNRFGIAYVATRGEAHDCEVLLRTRPPKGLLGGMAEVPTTDWTSKNASEPEILSQPECAPIENMASCNDQNKSQWELCDGQIKHVFTHITLRLYIKKAHFHNHTPALDGMRWVKLCDLTHEPLSTLMKKVLNHAQIGGV